MDKTNLWIYKKLIYLFSHLEQKIKWKSWGGQKKNIF